MKGAQVEMQRLLAAPVGTTGWQQKSTIVSVLNNRKQKMRKLHSRAALNKDISADNNCTFCVWGVDVFITVNVQDQTSLFQTFTQIYNEIIPITRANNDNLHLCDCSFCELVTSVACV